MATTLLLLLASSVLLHLQEYKAYPMFDHLKCISPIQIKMNFSNEWPITRCQFGVTYINLFCKFEFISPALLLWRDKHGRDQHTWPRLRSRGVASMIEQLWPAPDAVLCPMSSRWAPAREGSPSLYRAKTILLNKPLVFFTSGSERQPRLPSKISLWSQQGPLL